MNIGNPIITYKITYLLRKNIKKYIMKQISVI